MSNHYDHEQRVKIVAGPHFRCTGITQLAIKGDPPNSVRVKLDTSGREVVVPAEHVRPDVYGTDFEGAT